MTFKPVIDIEVNDEAFKKFLDLFQDYAAKLDEMPESWQRLDAAIGSAGNGMKAGAVSAKEALAIAAASASVIAEELHHATKAQHEFGRATTSSSSAMGRLASTAKGLGHTIFGMGKWLLKFSAIGLGLGALGSGFGFDELAGSALSRERSARSLGLTPGQLASFTANAQQFMGISALTGAAAAQVNPQDAGKFATLGINPNRARNESATRLAFEELKAARNSWQQYKLAGIDPMASPQVRAAISLGLSQGDIRNAAKARLSTINADERATRGDAAQLGFSSRTAAEWTRLKIAMDKAGTTIETSLIKALAPLAPLIGRMANEAARFIAAFVTGPEIKKLVAFVVDGLKEFMKFIHSPKFYQDLALFETSIGRLAHVTVTALRYLDIIPKAHRTDQEILMQAVKQPKKPPTTPWNIKTAAALEKYGPFGPNKYEITQAAIAAHKKYPNVPVSELVNLSGIESGYGSNMLGPKTPYGRALGAWQMLPGTAKAEGVRDPMAISDEAMGAARYLTQLQKQFGSRRAALAAYEAGPGTVAAQIKAHPHTWLNQAGPAERKETTAAGPGLPDSVNRLIKAIRNRAPVKPAQVHITNSTAARVSVSVNAVGL
jgi:hypothetical protein